MKARHILGAVAVMAVGVFAASSASADDVTPGKNADAPGREQGGDVGGYVLHERQNPSGRSLEDVMRGNNAPLTDARLAELKRQAAQADAPVYEPTDPENAFLKPPPLTAEGGN